MVGKPEWELYEIPFLKVTDRLLYIRCKVTTLKL